MKLKSFFVSVSIVGLLTASAVAIASQASTATPAEGAFRARLITQSQYVNTLRNIFGPNVRYPSVLAPMARTGGLTEVGASNAVITGGTLDRFDSSARTVAQTVLAPSYREYIMPCRPKSEKKADDACTGKFVSQVGELLFRRPLTNAEVKGFAAIARDATGNLGDYYSGLGATLAGMLVSPEFLYVVPTTEVVRGQEKLTGYSKAARLSLLLWNAYPDAELLKAAQNGSLNTPKGLAKQVDRMLNSPRLADGVRNFFEDMLIFERFETLAKDAKIYPAFTAQVTADAKEQTIRTILAHIVDGDEDYRDIFTTRKTFLTNDLAAVYGIPINQPDRWVPYEFPANGSRAGLLGQVSFLSLYSHPGRSSPTLRGRAIREIFLCQHVPNPPPNVDFTALENPDPTLKTARERLTAHVANPVCAGCHKITDPIGLSLENFDGAGSYRTTEADVRIDVSGNLDGAKFTDAVGLSQALRNNPRTPACLVERMTSYAMGRELGRADKDLLTQTTEKFAKDGYRVKELLRTITTDDAFFAVPKTAESSDAPKKGRI